MLITQTTPVSGPLLSLALSWLTPYLVWPFVDQGTGGWNRVGLTLAVVALFGRFLQAPHPTKQVSHLVPKVKAHSVAAALPLGSLLFILVNLFADSSTLIAWSWTGYENGLPKGPSPHLHGPLTFIAQSLGLLLCSTQPSSFGWFLYGAASAFVLYQYRNWPGYIGGLNFAVFVMSIIPLVLQRAAAARDPALTYSLAMLIYCLLQVAGVFTVAYAFVPGGEYFRERTGLYVRSRSAAQD